MTSRIKVLPVVVIAGCLLGLISVGRVAGQQPEKVQPQPAVSTPAPAPGETLPAPPKPAELTLEDRADIFMARKSYADAVDYYYRALKQRGNADPSLWNKLGIAYQHQMNYRAARNAYKKATRLRKEFPEPWNNWGTTYFLENRAGKSIKYYRRAIELNAANASFHLNLGTALYQRKKDLEAFEEWRVAITLDPNVLTDRSTVGTVLQARAADARFYFNLAKVFASVGRTEEAVRYLRRAFEDGFNDLKALDEDPGFKKISEYPAYIELRKNPPIPIKD